MGKVKKTDQVYRLEKELREYKDTIKSLERQLSKRDKEKTREDKEEKKKEKLEKRETNINNKCPECSDGTIVVSDLGVREIRSCSKKCGYRNVVKITNGEKNEQKV